MIALALWFWRLGVLIGLTFILIRLQAIQLLLAGGCL